MATEVCDCGGTCATCNPAFISDGIRIEITLEGTVRGERRNRAVSQFYVRGEGLTKKDQRKIVERIKRALKLEAHHFI